MRFYAYTKQANQVMRTAQNLAKEKGLRVLGTEYILLGMIREKDGVAGQILRGHSVREATVLHVVDEMLLPIPEEGGADTFTLLPETEQVLKRA
ncbi:MAG: Clp protease N-terminal domain-containing protein, partial [Clostridiales bacterium]|nr:Clp protease N-terminal domain-containing protein [Clostridiales bacterium]